MRQHPNISAALMLMALMAPLASQAADPSAGTTSAPAVSGKALPGGALTAKDLLPYNQAVNDFNAANASNDAVLFAKTATELQAVEFGKAYGANPEIRSNVHSLLGYIALKQNHTATAITELQTTVSLSPKDLSARNNLANALQQSENYGAAATQYQYILDQAPLSGSGLDVNRIQYNLATVLGQAGRYDESFTNFQALLAKKPDSVTYSSYGYFLQKAGRKTDAADAMRQAAALNPKDAQSWFNAGLLYADANQSDQAIAALSNAVGPDVDPKLDMESAYNAYFTLGQLYAAGKDRNQAVREFQLAAQLHPNDIAPLYNIAALEDQAGRKTEAEDAYRRVLTVKPGDGQTLISLGMLLADDGKTKEATAMLAQAVQQTPDSAPAHARLADLYAKQGDLADANHERQTALTLDATDDNTRLALADAYLKGKQYGPALVQYDIVAHHQPRNTGVLNSRGLAYVQMKNYNAALGAFRQALAANPRNAEAENNIGVTYEKKGQSAEALAAYKKAVAFDPTLVAARVNLARLAGK